jgi:hypothetical protein
VELNDDHVGTEHLLLALLREKEGIAARLLTEIGLTEDSVRAEIVRAFPHGEDQAKTTPTLRPLNACLFSDAERDFHLSIYRLAVDYYKPRIEKRSGVSLGDIAVWEFEKLPGHEMAEISRQKSRWLPYVLWRLLHGKRLSKYAEQLARSNAIAGRRYTACYFRRAIYVSFASGVQHEEEVATTVVHELSHALWETLSGVPFHAQPSGTERLRPKDRRILKLLIEGFAVYCEKAWFLDLYPGHLRESVQKRKLIPDSVYERGFLQVNRLVEKYGSEIVLEIPKRWHELNVG